MTIAHGQPVASKGAQDFVAAEALVHAAQDGAQSVHIEALGESRHLICAGHGMAQEAAPRPLAAGFFEHQEAWGPAKPKHQERRVEDQRGDFRLLARIAQACQFLVQFENLLPILQGSAEQGATPSRRRDVSTPAY